MKAVTVLVFFFLVDIAAYADPVIGISGQLNPLHNHEVQLTARYRSCHKYSNCLFREAESLPDKIDLAIIAEPGQSLWICADNVFSPETSTPVSAVSFASDTIPVIPVHQIITSAARTELTLVQPSVCPELVGQSLPYDAGEVLWSESPFLVSLVKSPPQPKAKDDKDSPALPFLPFNPDPSKVRQQLMQDGGLPFDDYGNDHFRRRPGGFLPDGKDISLTLLPLMRLDWNWRRILSMSQWRHWLFGSRDEDAGVTLAIRFNRDSPVYLQLSQTEFRALAAVLHDTREILKYLMPRLSGRQAFIEQLLTLYSSTPTLTRSTRRAIRQQIATLLDWPDAEFSLDFEVSQFLGAIVADLPVLSPEPTDGSASAKKPKPDQWIRQLPVNQPDDSGQRPAGTGKASGESTDASGSQGKDLPAGNEEQQAGQGSPDQKEPQASASMGMPDASQEKPLTITFIGRVNSGKSSLANCLLGIKHFDVKDTRNPNHEKDFTTLPGLRIRALEGYGGPAVPSRNFPDQQKDDLKIHRDEVVIIVIADSMDRKDKQVLRNLIKEKHRLERIIFVRSKFDTTLEGRLNERESTERDGGARDAKEELERELRKNHLSILQKVLTDQELKVLIPHSMGEPDEERMKEWLPLLSATDISTFKDEDDRALVSAIRSVLNEEERPVFDRFEQLRPKNIEAAKKEIHKQAWEVIRKKRERAFSTLMKRLNKVYDIDLSEDEISEGLHEFKKLFGCYFDQGIRSNNESLKSQLVRQFTSYYLTKEFGERCYEFFEKYLNKQFLKGDDRFGQTHLHQWARTGRYGWLSVVLQHVSRRSAQRKSVPFTVKDALETRDNNGRTPLHLAVYSGNEESVEAILEHSADSEVVDAKDKVGYTPLHWAAYYGRVEIAKQLLSHGASLPENRREKITALHLAAWAGQVGMIRMLIAEGVDVNIATMDGNTPLDYASLSGNRGSLDTLLDYEDIQPNHLSNRGLTALDLVIHHTHNNQYAISKLRSKNAETSRRYLFVAPKLPEHSYNYLYWDTEVDYRKMYEPSEYFWLLMPLPPMADKESRVSLLEDSPLLQAIREGDVSFIQNQNFLEVSYGKDQWTLLHLASGCGHAAIVDILLKKAAERFYTLGLVKFVVNKWAANKLTPLHLAAYGGHTKVVEKLLDAGGDSSARTAAGETALHHAAVSGKTELIDLLIKDEVYRVRPDINEKTNTGQTALHIAAMFGHARLVEYLCVLGADPNAVDINKFTPLHLAALYGQTDVVKSLRHTGFAHNPLTILEANPDLLTIHGEAPIHLAALSNHISVLEILVEWAKTGIKANAELYPRLHFVGISAYCRVKATALHYAASRGWDEAVRILAQNKENILEPCTRKGWVALHFAAYSGHCSTIRLLVEEFETPVDIRNAMEAGWRTPLHLAYENDQAGAIDTLKQLNADSSKITFWQTLNDRWFPSPLTQSKKSFCIIINL